MRPSTPGCFLGRHRCGTLHLRRGGTAAGRYTYAEATATQQLPDWVGAHTRMAEYFGGATSLGVPDQLKSTITRSCRYEPGINRTYEELAAHYGAVVVPARPRKPRDKAAVENGVLIAQRWVLARLRHQTFFRLEALNRAIRTLLDDLNDRPMQQLGVSRRTRYARLDRPALRPLPAARYVLAQWTPCRVYLDYLSRSSATPTACPTSSSTRPTRSATGCCTMPTASRSRAPRCGARRPPRSPRRPRHDRRPDRAGAPTGGSPGRAPSRSALLRHPRTSGRGPGPMDPASGMENAGAQPGTGVAAGCAFPTPLWTAHAPATGSTGRHRPRSHTRQTRVGYTDPCRWRWKQTD